MVYKVDVNTIFKQYIRVLECTKIRPHRGMFRDESLDFEDGTNGKNKSFELENPMYFFYDSKGGSRVGSGFRNSLASN